MRSAVKQMTDETPTRDGTSSGKRKLPSAMPRTTMRIGIWNKACRDSMASMSDSLFTVNSMDLRTSWHTISVVESSKHSSYFPFSWHLERWRFFVKIRMESADSGFIEKSLEILQFQGILVRPTRFERATYRVGAFRRILIKCCIFKGYTVFCENVRLFWMIAKPLKTQGKPAFETSRTIVVKQ